MAEGLKEERQLLLSLAVMRRAFVERLAGENNDNGAILYTAVMDRCGLNETDPERIRPELVAFGTWFKNMCGVGQSKEDVRGRLRQSAGYQEYLTEARKTLELANTKDVDAALAENQAELEKEHHDGD